MSEEIEIDLLPDGTVRYPRINEDINVDILEIMESIAPDQKAQIQEFLNGSMPVEKIFGNEPLCG